MSDFVTEALAGGVLLAVLAAVAFLLQSLQRSRLARDFKALSADMAFAEEIARVGYWSRPAGSNQTKWSAGVYEIFEQDPQKFIPLMENVKPLFFAGDWEEIQALNEVRASLRAGLYQLRSGVCGCRTKRAKP